MNITAIVVPVLNFADILPILNPLVNPIQIIILFMKNITQKSKKLKFKV